jgi:hypothetical protein
VQHPNALARRGVPSKRKLLCDHYPSRMLAENGTDEADPLGTAQCAGSLKRLHIRTTMPVAFAAVELPPTIELLTAVSRSPSPY